ncbi:uncharacterized protein [Centroberyx affinis]|uniref:uncharacterized protein n=1 Tax=Centroberyx affinis TaxID=166261 RepID=UPI003A5BBE96
MDAVVSVSNDLPVSYLRLLAPPLQLFSAAMWQVVQQGLVDHYGMLEEFVTMVTELVPELMSYSQRAQLTLGLRARLVLELCGGEHPVDLQTIQPHLDRIKAPISTAKDHHVTINQVEESEVNFVELVHTLLENPSEREHFFQEIFPVHFGSKYDTALEMLVWEFISRLEELLPVPDITQMAAWLGGAPSLLDDCLQSFSPPGGMKAVLEHHRNLGHFEEKDPSLLPMDDCILSSLSLPPKLVINTASCSSTPVDSPLPEKEVHPNRRNSETIRHKMREKIDSGNSRLKVRGGNGNISQERGAQNSVSTFPHDKTSAIDLSPSEEPAVTDSAANENSQSLRGGHVLRKRKLSGSLEVPSKQPMVASAFLDSSVDVESSSESPLISIWGEYTDPQEASYPVVTDTKVPWSDDETLNLLDIWGKDSVQRVLKGCLKNRHIFTLISQKMAERGYMRTVEQCQTRIKRLKKCFRQCLQNNKGNPRLECKFYDQLERVLGTAAPSAVPEVTYDVEEVIDEDESQDGGEDWQFLGHTGREDIGTRSVPWTDLETLALINIWGEDKIQQELRGMHRTGHIFSIISNKMATQGFSRTAEQCQTRVKRLKANFRQCYENNMKGQERAECKFYDELARILIKDLPSLELLADSNNDLDLDPGPGEPTDKDFSAFSHQEIEPAVGVQEERKKVPWSDRETLILLEIWGEHQVQQNLRRCPHNGHIFSDISEKLGAGGYSRSAEQCHTRIKRLKASYRQCQENMSSSGTDRVDFKFYDLLEQILEKQPSTSTVVTDSIEISEDSNGDSVNETAPGSWSDEETLALIDIWGEEDVQRALRGFVHNGHVYADISEKMHDLGYSKTPEQCRWKVKSLRNNFRQCYDRKKCGRNKVEYKFYNQLEEILGQEAVSIDEYDEKDEQADQDTDDQASTSHLLAESSRKMPWSDRETRVLLEIWGEDSVQVSLRGCLKNRHVFEYVSEKMSARGFIRTTEQCYTRIKRLKAGFLHDKEEFKFFDQMEEIFRRELKADSSAGDASATEEAADSTPVLGQKKANQWVADGSKLPWSDGETEVLLDIWGSEEIQEDLRGCTKNKHIFVQISQAMASQGFLRTPEQCQTRIKRLRANFRQFVEGKIGEKQECKFFDQLVRIFGSKYVNAESLAEESMDVMESGSCPSP